MKSMTGFGRATVTDHPYELSVELRTVNNRYLEFSIRMPKEYTVFENDIRKYVKQKLQRGKISIFIGLSTTGAGPDQAIITQSRARELATQLESIRNAAFVATPATLQDILYYHTLADSGMPDLDEDRFKALLMDGLDKALTQLQTMRGEEGVHLKEDMLTRLEQISSLTDLVNQRAKTNVRENFDRLYRNVLDLMEQDKLDKARLEQEIAIISDKVDITEECVRMQSHIKLFTETINRKGEKGKKLTFILQEMLREANTMNSKNANVDIQHQVIRIKEEIEKIREQAQNIE